MTLLPALDQARFEVAAVCLEERGSLFDELVAAGIPARAFHGHGSKVGMSVAFLRLLETVYRFEPDLIITAHYNADLFGRVAGRILRVPATVSWRHCCGQLAHFGRRDRLTERVMGRFATRYFAVAFGQVPYLVDDLRLAPHKIRVIRNSVQVAPPLDESRRRALGSSLGLQTGDQVVGMIAMLRPEKDHTTMLRAFQAVVSRAPRAKLLLVGDGPERHGLSVLATELRIAESVMFLGERFDARELLQLVDVAALCSYAVECLPYAILEAMAAAKPVVSSAVGGVPELVEDGLTGYLVPPRDPHALAGRIVSLLHDTARAERMGEAGRQRLETRFGFAEMCSLVEDELTDAVVAGRRPGRAPVGCAPEALAKPAARGTRPASEGNRRAFRRGDLRERTTDLAGS